MLESVLVSHEPERIVEQLQELIALGVESIDLHNVGRNQKEFIDVFGRDVLPKLR
jgi:alkanesulfonate monooxygenase SsuD/methylene tetrahydromethanopterin reductase-like flavin-dependent oxidoreductase (luciferase family)